jgi:putative ABC transport system permease protein
MLPLSYAARNLLRQPGRALQTVFGSALVVALISFSAAFTSGIDASLSASGDPANVILLGAGSEESVERSEVAANVPGIVAASVAGLASDFGQIAVSGEIVHNGLISAGDGPARQAILRGVTPAALAVHRAVRVSEGQWPGPDEVLVGARAATQLGLPEDALTVGSSITFEGRQLRISGRFIGPGTVLESELWLGLSDLMEATRRDSLSCVIARRDRAELADLAYFCSTRLDLELIALAEDAYYARLSTFFAPLKMISWLTAALIAAGAVFGGLNTLFVAIVARMSELASLQAIGFPRRALALSLLIESLLACLAGSALGLAACLFLLDGMSLAFSAGAFVLHFGPQQLTLGLATGVALAVIGIIAPTWRCLAPPLTSTLR